MKAASSKRAVGSKGSRHEAREVDGAEAAAAVGRQRLLAAGVGGGDGLAVREIVVGVDAVEEQHAGFGVVVGGPHDLVPQLACGQAAVDPQAVAALVGAGGLLLQAGLGSVHQFHVRIGFHGLHEEVGQAHRDVEVAQVAAVLGVDEFLHVRVVAAQHAHLRAAARAGGFDRLAGAVEHAHVAHRARGVRARAAHPGAARADAREVVAHTAAAAHGLGGFGERGVDAGVAVVVLGNRVAHGLHEAVDERGRQLGAGGGVDAPGRNEPVFQRLQKACLPQGTRFRRFHLRQGAGDAAAHVGDAAFVALGVLLQQHFLADCLGRQGGGGGT